MTQVQVRWTQISGDDVCLAFRLLHLLGVSVAMFGIKARSRGTTVVVMMSGWSGKRSSWRYRMQRLLHHTATV